VASKPTVSPGRSPGITHIRPSHPSLVLARLASDGHRILRMAQSPPYLHPFACFVGRRSFKRPGVDRNEAPCPVCGNQAIRLSRKFRPPRREDVSQWAKVENLVNLGFRFDTIYDGAGGTVRYPSSRRGIPAFVERVAALRAEENARRRSQAKSMGRRTQTGRKRQAITARHSRKGKSRDA
jgi:hypothetical protein